MAGFFITGTDTGIGKTCVTTALMCWLRRQGVSVVGLKPVASGCAWRQGRWVNDDALQLQQNASLQLPYEQVNPYAYAPPVSPHIAAKRSGVEVSMGRIQDLVRHAQTVSDCVLVEGIGGWRVPLSEDVRVSDLARALQLPVVLVVGLRLGCLNHAFLTHEAITADGLDCAGWIANQLDPDFPYIDENVETLQLGLASPFLGLLPFRSTQGVPPEIQHFREFGPASILRRLGV